MSGHQGTFYRRRRVLCSYFFLPAALLRSSNVEALLSHLCYYLSIPFSITRTGSSSRTDLVRLKPHLDRAACPVQMSFQTYQLVSQFGHNPQRKLHSRSQKVRFLAGGSLISFKVLKAYSSSVVRIRLLQCNKNKLKGPLVSNTKLEGSPFY